MQLVARHHRLIRFLSVGVTVASLTYMALQAGFRLDITSEGLSRITPGTLELISGVSEERPVMVHAFVSRDVPRDYVPVRQQIVSILRELDARGGTGLTVRIVEPELHSVEAQEAMDKYRIAPVRVVNREGGRLGENQLFLGIAFVSGPREEVIPFVDRGLSVEYEFARALRVVTQEKKKVLGVLRTDAPIMGNFDLQARRQQPAWRVVEELKKQYEARSLNPDAKIPDDVDVLMVPQVSSLTQEQLDIVKAYVDAGRPALLTVDPMPLFDLRLAPGEPKLPPPGQGGGFGGGGGPSEPKGDFVAFLRDVGVQWTPERVVFDTFNPHPSFADVPPHVVFVSKRPDGTDPFTAPDPIVQGLSEVVMLFPGVLTPVSGREDELTPLLATGKASGFNVFDDMVQKHMLFGVQGPFPPRKRGPITNESLVLGARIQSFGSGQEKPRNVVVLGDLDLVGDQFFAMHERGGDIDGDGLDDIRFDNVSFLLNVVDTLAGDDRFVELRKRKPSYRRLERVDELTREARAEREREIQDANAKAEAGLEEAQKALNQAVDAIKDQQGLDETTKQIMAKSAEEAENRRLKAKQEAVELAKERAVTRTEAEHMRKVDEIQNRIRLLAVLLPPVPALIMGTMIFARKRRRERETIPQSRKRGAQ